MRTYIPANARGTDPRHHHLRRQVRRPDIPRRPAQRRHVSAGAVIAVAATSAPKSTPCSRIWSECCTRSTRPSSTPCSPRGGRGVRGRGQRIGEATTAANQVLLAQINPRSGDRAQDWRALKGVCRRLQRSSPGHARRARCRQHHKRHDHPPRLGRWMRCCSTRSASPKRHRACSRPTSANLIKAINTLRPHDRPADEVQPRIHLHACGAKWSWTTGPRRPRRKRTLDRSWTSTFLFSDDPYRYPDNLPIVAPRAARAANPGCGSLPDVSKNYPVRQLVTNTGWGTGLDIRPNPGVALNPAAPTSCP